MAIFHTYKLNDAELFIAQTVGKARNDKCRKIGVSQNKHSLSRSSIYIDQNGAAGEIAFAGMLLSLDIITKEKHKKELDRICESSLKSAKLGLDDGDVEIMNYNIDVKTSEYESAHLWLTSSKINAVKVDYYCLITGDINTSNIFKYRGCLSRSFIEKNWSVSSGKFHQRQLKYFPWKEEYV